MSDGRIGPEADVHWPTEPNVDPRRQTRPHGHAVSIDPRTHDDCRFAPETTWPASRAAMRNPRGSDATSSPRVHSLSQHHLEDTAPFFSRISSPLRTRSNFNVTSFAWGASTRNRISPLGCPSAHVSRSLPSMRTGFGGSKLSAVLDLARHVTASRGFTQSLSVCRFRRSSSPRPGPNHPSELLSFALSMSGNSHISTASLTTSYGKRSINNLRIN
jgi:hypothetical protein